ncbi:MAG: MCE family protein [Gammaproteobacteria bacterium]|jgi:paraquat-inducible protein B|nr:MCE family protein [Gammaproteobacteria bacterium]MBU0772244.1 MCE family protein [Gammaproteobacteria bacterium]MBU0855306.1 MCE family protein [Gammaproteobacteria bacterium]MBU1848371.1 MCE family protein [Gammaproteobacteria bacterium]
MTEPSLPTATVSPPRRFRIPLVWIIPLVAALIGAFLAVRTWYEQGPLITIRFDTGAGLEPGKTRIKYKAVDVGQITSVALADDGKHVIASARLAREAGALLVEDTRFWVVSARVSGSAVSGLETLLSGTYVGMDAGKSGTASRAFVALDQAPVITFDEPGRTFTLHAQSLGSVDVGTPVYFRRIPTGQVTRYQLDDSGTHLDIDVFIKSPYDRFVTPDTRFWNASGIDVKLGADGVQLNTESLTSIVTGGLAFVTPDGTRDEPAPERHDFQLFATRAEALRQPNATVQTYLLRFTESVRGLSPGAPVDFRGIQVGEVSAIRPDLNEDSGELGLLVEVSVFPDRMQPGAPDGTDTIDARFRTFIDKLIARGLRAQLRNANLVTGQLYVALDFFPDAQPGSIAWAQTPPRLPTQRGSLDQLQETLLRIVAKLDRLPLEDISRDARTAINSLTRAVGEAETLFRRIDTLADGELRDTLVEARGTLSDTRSAIADTRRLLASDAPLQQDLRDSLQEMSRAAQALRNLADTLERHPEALLRGKPEDTP